MLCASCGQLYDQKLATIKEELLSEARSSSYSHSSNLLSITSESYKHISHKHKTLSHKHRGNIPLLLSTFVLFCLPFSTLPPPSLSKYAFENDSINLLFLREWPRRKQRQRWRFQHRLKRSEVFPLSRHASSQFINVWIKHAHITTHFLCLVQYNTNFDFLRIWLWCVDVYLGSLFSFKNAAFLILKEVGQPLTVKQITELALKVSLIYSLSRSVSIVLTSIDILL
jgi:hypothetical protein